MNSNKKSNKISTTGKSQINTEKLYLFRKACEVAYRERNKGKGTWKIFKDSFKSQISWWSLQVALELVELYEETKIEALRKISKQFRDELLTIKENAKSPQRTFRNILKNGKN